MFLMDKEKFLNMVAVIYANMNNVLVDEDKRQEIIQLSEEGEELDETFFLAELLALRLQFKQLTGIDQDMIDFIGTLNKLVFQYMLEVQKDELNKI